MSRRIADGSPLPDHQSPDGTEGPCDDRESDDDDGGEEDEEGRQQREARARSDVGLRRPGVHEDEDDRKQRRAPDLPIPPREAVV